MATTMQAEYRGKTYKAEAKGEGAFNAAWERIAAKLPEGEDGDETDLTEDGAYFAGVLAWQHDGWLYLPYSSDGRRA